MSALLPLCLVASGCGGSGGNNSQAAAGKGAGGPGAQGPKTVGYVVAAKGSSAVVSELSGRTAAYQTSEVRPQVSGLIRRRFFTEGSLVRAGQPLYQIDPRLYRASVNEAQANLSSAQANAEATRIKSERYKPLADMEAVAAQDYTDAAASARQAGASVQQSRAALETARVNLQFTTVPAPITGRIGRSLFTEGALVSASQTDPLTTIQRLDPMYVDIQQSSADLITLRKALAAGGVIPASADVRLKLEDGSDYGAVGRVEFAEVTVDTSTGTVTLRARFPNPNGLLLPGMFVRAVFTQSVDPNVILVPQQALSRDPRGQATVFIVGPGNKAQQKTVTAVRTQGTFWVVTAGLNPGDKIITQGLAQLRPGQDVKPVPANTPEKVSPPSQGQSPQGAQAKR